MFIFTIEILLKGAYNPPIIRFTHK